MKNSNIKSNRNQIIISAILIVFIVITSFSLGYLVSRYFPLLPIGKFRVLMEAYSVLEKNYLNTLPSGQDLEYGMIQGMLSKVEDPYTMFVEPVQHELQTNQLEGKFGGIGARLERDSDGFLLLYPFPNSPAEQAGIADGDRLIAVGELQITPDMPLDEIQAAIRGPVGKKIELTVSSLPGLVERTVQVAREEISLPSVTWNLASSNTQVGVIQVNIIAATTPNEIKTAMLDLQALGARYFILDLRNNSGGLLQAGVETVELFLPKGAILQQQYKDKPAETIESSEDGEFYQVPLALLVNHGSASAAEIIAGAIQAEHRGVIIGSNTYGKNTIQLVFDLSDGSSLHVTAAKWSIPGLATSIGATGLIPDIAIPDEETLEPGTLDIAITSLINANQ
jgi:carboxyl-terminal processing protease